MNPAENHRDFALRGAPTEWRDYALDLFEAAHALASQGKQHLTVSSDELRGVVKRPGFSRTTVLLYALSIENLLKGLLVAENPSYLSNGSLSREVTGGSHDLLNINRKLKKSPIRKKDARILKILQSAIPSWGRYPIPKRFEDVTFEQIVTQEFVAHVEEIYRRLDRFLYDSVKEGWRGPHGAHLTSCYCSEHETLPPGWMKMSFDELMDRRPKSRTRRQSQRRDLSRRVQPNELRNEM